MSEFMISTDSTCDLPSEMVEKLGISIIPFNYTIDGSTHSDFSSEIDNKTFYQMLARSQKATTSQPNPENYMETFKKILADGKDILHISFSSGLSNGYGSAQIAQKRLQDEFPDRKILVVDSLCASMGFGLLVYAATLKKNSGMELEELAEWSTKNRLKICHIFTVADLTQLKKGGRVSPTVAFFGSLLNIKPLMHVNREGKLEVYSKARGREKSLDMMVKRIKETIDAEREIKDIFISQGDCVDDAVKLKELIHRDVGAANVLIGDLGPVIGCHAGKGTLAVFYFGNDRS